MNGRKTGVSYWWLRTPNPSNTTNAYNVAAAGTTNNNTVTNSYGVRPIYLV